MSVRVTAREGAAAAHRMDASGEASSVTVRIERGRLDAAQNRGLDVEYLRAQLGRLGNTPYELARSRRWMRKARRSRRASMLNQVRREAVEQAARRAEARRSPRTAGHALARAGRNAGGSPEALAPLAPAGAHAGATGSRHRTSAREHHARLSGSLRPAALDRARARRRHRGARRQPARAQARRGAHRRFPAELRLPDPGALQPACCMRCATANIAN